MLNVGSSELTRRAADLHARWSGHAVSLITNQVIAREDVLQEISALTMNTLEFTQEALANITERNLPSRPRLKLLLEGVEEAVYQVRTEIPLVQLNLANSRPISPRP